MPKKTLLSSDNHMSDLSKILYLEIIDMTFSIDGVLGAFAICAIDISWKWNWSFVLRELTGRNIDKIKKYMIPKKMEQCILYSYWD